MYFVVRYVVFNGERMENSANSVQRIEENEKSKLKSASSKLLVGGSLFLFVGGFMGSKWVVKKNHDRVLNVDPTIAPLATVFRTPVEWLWPGRIVAGNLTLLIGDPDVGKSLLAMDLAARLSRGGEWPDGQPNERPAGVVLLSAEDHLHYSVRPALDQAGADLAGIISLWDVRVQRESGTFVRPFELKRDMNVLGKAIRSVKNCKLVVIDPLAAFLGFGANPRSTLNELMKLASCEHVAVLGVAHLKPGGRHALYRTMGAFDLTTAARAVWMVARDPASQERRLVLPVKNNLAAENAGMAFSLTMDEGAYAPRVEWLEMNVETTADEALASITRKCGPSSDRCDEAVVYLKYALAQGPRLVKEIDAEAWRVCRIRHRTLERARKALGVAAFRMDIRGPWWLRLPLPDEAVKSGCEIDGGLGGLGGLGKNAEEIEGFQTATRPPNGGVGSEAGGGNAEVGS
jgi:hypothetical protein